MECLSGTLNSLYVFVKKNYGCAHLSLTNEISSMDSCSSFGHVTSYSPPFDLDRTVQKRALRLRLPEPPSRVVDMPAHRPPLPPGAPTPPSLLPCPPPGHPPLPHKTEPRFRSSHSCSCRSTRRRGRNPKRGRGPHLPPDEALPWIICAIRGLPLPT